MSEWRSWLPSFDRWATTYDAQVRDDPWFRYEAAWAFVRRAIEDRLGPVAGRMILDVGCGTGEYVRRWRELGGEVVGVEPSVGMRAVAAAKLPGAPILNGHLGAIPLPDDAVDAAMVTYTLSHLTRDEKPAALAELERVVRQGGPVVVVDVAIDGDADLPRVRRVLEEAGRGDQAAWYQGGFAIDLPALRATIEERGGHLEAQRLGPLLMGLAWAAGRTDRRAAGAAVSRAARSAPAPPR